MARDRGSSTPTRAQLQAKHDREQDALSRSRKVLGLDLGEKIGGTGSKASQYKSMVSSNKKKKKSKVSTVLSDTSDPEMKSKSMPSEESLSKKTLLGV